MALLKSLLALFAAIIPTFLSCLSGRDARRLANTQPLQLHEPQRADRLQAKPSAIAAEAGGGDPWTSRARPAFLYVMYGLILWALPMGVISALSPATAGAIASGMHTYLEGLPEPLYALFGAGYLGYTAARQWGKIAGSDR